MALRQPALYARRLTCAANEESAALSHVSDACAPNKDRKTLLIAIKALRLSQQLIFDEEGEDAILGINKVVAMLEAREQQHALHDREFEMDMARQRGE